ncbi:hypothetical protein HK104_005236 [Borealophlyctis nickersoniae]|nr:hypothetical protein HK104_005236 [Borealophlyctis nickersoniae]
MWSLWRRGVGVSLFWSIRGEEEWCGARPIDLLARGGGEEWCGVRPISLLARGGGEEWEAMRLKAARVLVFGLGMPLFRILFLRYVIRISIARVGATAATSMEALNAGSRGRKAEVEDVEDVENVEERRKDLLGGRAQTLPRVSKTTQSVVDRERSAKTHLDPAATKGDCERGSITNTVPVDKDEIIADPGLVRMLLGFESAFSMVDTVIILLTPDNTAFALAILSSHFVHIVQCLLRARRWRNVLAEIKLKTGGTATGLNTWVTITTTNGAAAYITDVAAMVMVLWFDARGVFDHVHPHATREQVATRTAVTVVVQLVVNTLSTASESRSMGVGFKWKRVRLPLFAKFEAAAMVMIAVGGFLVVERGVFGVF